jgi:hypothetical protein
MNVGPPQVLGAWPFDVHTANSIEGLVAAHQVTRRARHGAL